MKTNDFTKAIEIISKYYNVKISINQTVNDHISNTYPILIHNCCPALINDLVSAGYSLGMADKGLWVDKY